MRALSFAAAAVSMSLLVAACSGGSNRHDVVTPDDDAPAERRPPPGTRVDTWPDVAHEPVMPGSRDPFLWEIRPASTPPQAQVPLRLHRPIE
jgi:hypothetical protein